MYQLRFLGDGTMITLKQARKSKEMTQEGLGYLSGVGARCISEIENGHRNPTPKQQDALLEALEMDADDVAFCIPCFENSDGEFIRYETESEILFDDDDEEEHDEGW